MIGKNLTATIILALSHVLAAEASGQQLRVVPSVDLSRYAGLWYEIARLPNRFQENCAGEISARYELLDGGEIRVVNQCEGNNGKIKKVEGRARRATKDGSNAKLEVRFAPTFLSFLPLVWGDYWIIELAPDYSYAMIGEPGRKYLWILARKPQLEEAVLQDLLRKATSMGYDTSRIIRTRQAT